MNRILPNLYGLTLLSKHAQVNPLPHQYLEKCLIQENPRVIKRVQKPPPDLLRWEMRSIRNQMEQFNKNEIKLHNKKSVDQKTVIQQHEKTKSKSIEINVGCHSCKPYLPSSVFLRNALNKTETTSLFYILSFSVCHKLEFKFNMWLSDDNGTLTEMKIQ